MPPKVLVIGSGVIGLRTTLELLKRKIRVCLLSPRSPIDPSTCSMGAGGLWMPFHCDDERTDRWAFETLDELLKIASSKNCNGNKVQEKSLVEMLPAIAFQRDNLKKIPEWALDSNSKRLGFQYTSIDALYEESKTRRFRLPHKESMTNAGYSHAWLFETPIVDSPKMLMRMLEEIKSNQYTELINVETGRYYTNMKQMIDEAKNLGCGALVNCTGLGSKQLCNDHAMVGARGVLLHFDRTSCVWKHDNNKETNDSSDVKDSVIMIESPPFGSDAKPCYMIPRGDVIAVGGTYLEGDGEVSIRSKERETIIGNADAMGIDTNNSKPIGSWVGHRPYRPSVRLEFETNLSPSEGVTVVHNYGAGGSGWTIYIGAAKEAASLISSSFDQ